MQMFRSIGRVRLARVCVSLNGRSRLAGFTNLEQSRLLFGTGDERRSGGGGATFSPFLPIPVAFAIPWWTKSDREELIEAAKEGRMEDARRLLQRRVNVNTRGGVWKWFFSGVTPLYQAVQKGHLEMANLLLKYGADPNELNGSFLGYLIGRNETALDAASRIGNAPIHEALLNVSVSTHTDIANKEQGLAARKEASRLWRLEHPLEERLRERLVCQEAAIKDVAAAIRCSLNGWGDGKHPLVLLFLGSSGVGKTEMAKEIAAWMDKPLIRFDMCEYQQKRDVAKLIGAPPGSSDQYKGSSLISKLNGLGKEEEAVVLFDEIGEAHPDVLTVLLQLFDEGRLTGGDGVTVERPNVIFIMTSTLLAKELSDYADKQRDDGSWGLQRWWNRPQDERNSTDSTKDNVIVSPEFESEKVRPKLKERFLLDEFLGRITKIVYFMPFSKKGVEELVKHEMKLLEGHMKDKEKHGITITWTPEVVAEMAKSYNKLECARSIQKAVNEQVVSQLSEAQSKGDIKKGVSVQIFTDAKGNVGIKRLDSPD